MALPLARPLAPWGAVDGRTDGRSRSDELAGCMEGLCQEYGMATGLMQRDAIWAPGAIGKESGHTYGECEKKGLAYKNYSLDCRVQLKCKDIFNDIHICYSSMQISSIIRISCARLRFGFPSLCVHRRIVAVTAGAILSELSVCGSSSCRRCARAHAEISHTGASSKRRIIRHPPITATRPTIDPTRNVAGT